jgi:hypothetical protein
MCRCRAGDTVELDYHRPLIYTCLVSLCRVAVRRAQATREPVVVVAQGRRKADQRDSGIRAPWPLLRVAPRLALPTGIVASSSTMRAVPASATPLGSVRLARMLRDVTRDLSAGVHCRPGVSEAHFSRHGGRGRVLRINVCYHLPQPWCIPRVIQNWPGRFRCQPAI